MPDYGIDWSKVDAKNDARLDSLRPKQTAVTTEGQGRAKSTRSQRTASPDATVKSSRRASAKTAPSADTSETVTTETTSADSDELDRVIEKDGRTSDDPNPNAG